MIFLVGFRIGLNVTNSNVIDVGYAGVIGAHKVLANTPLYGHWGYGNPAGDTYGPINYYTYIPFNLIFGWSGLWDSLPAAHAAAIAFDVLTILGLFVLGWMIRGPTLGTVLAYLWAAYPFTLYVLSSNSNDALVALWLVIALLVVRSAAARGVAVAWAGLTKFAPLALAPLLLRGIGPAPNRRTVCSSASRSASPSSPRWRTWCSTATLTGSGAIRSPTRRADPRRSRSGGCGAEPGCR